MKVVVTGCSSHLARALLPRLCLDERIDCVTGIDMRACNFTHHKFAFVQRDIRDPAIGEDLAGASAVVHLAFVVLQGDLRRDRHNRHMMRDINVNGSLHVAMLAASQGVETFIHLSSASVYATPAPIGIGESHALGSLPGFGYAEDKVEVEQRLDTFEATTSLRVVRLRPHVILGPHAQGYLKALLRWPFCPALPTPLPKTQCVHEDDVVTAILLALFDNARGAFNLAGDGELPFAALLETLHGKVRTIPFGLARSLVAASWYLAGMGTHPGWFAALRENLVLDTTRAREELGWQPNYDCVSAARAAFTREPGRRG